MKTIDLLNKLLTELTLAERNIHILHWNVMGKQFKMLHEYFQEIYEDLYDKIDQVAELIRIHEELPKGNLSEALEMAVIEEIESSNNFNHVESIGLALQDIEVLIDLTNELFEASEKDKLYDVNDVMGSHLGDYGKFKYFLDNFNDNNHEIKDTVDTLLEDKNLKNLDKDIEE